ncbi:MAG: carbohydrate ABC transporter permease [Oscillospiraceae bacterium]
MKWKDIKKSVIKNLDCYLMLLPFMILFIIFTVIPVLMALPLGFTDFDGIKINSFVGLDNFKALFFSDRVFIKSLKNTFIIALFTGPVSYIISFLLAWLINELKPFWRSFFTLIFYIPSMANLYAVWRIIFSGDAYGYLNSLLINHGILTYPVQWLTNPKYTIWIVIAVQMWMSSGAGFLAMSAGFRNIDISLYEAGAVEGIANRWQELYYIVIPEMKPQLLFAGVMQIISAFTSDIVGRSLAGFPSTDYSVHTVMTHAYDYGWIRFEMGYASAICTVLFVIMYLANLAVSAVLGKNNEE